MPDTFSTTAEDVLDGIDLTGRTALVRGATSGLGLESALALSRAGGDLGLVGRDTEKLDAATAEVAAQGPGSASGVAVDLADTEAAAEVAARLAGIRRAVESATSNAFPASRS